MDCYIDLKSGIPITPKILSIPATNNGSGLVRCTKTNHGFPDQAVVHVNDAIYGGVYVITKIDNNVFDLNASVYTVNRTLTDVVHIGGSSWETAVNNILLQNISTQNINNDLNVKVAKTPIVNLGINASFTKLSNTVVLDSALTKVVDDCIGNTWVASANVTGGTSTVRHLGATSQQFTIGTIANFPVSSKVAYKAFASQQDFSAFTKLSFWFGCNSPYYGIQNGSCFKICLCSDAIGNVIVNELPLFDVQGANNLNSMVLDYGAALGSNINSVALYLTSECRSATGTIAVFLNNIVACNTLHHETIVGKNNGTGFWSAIKYIDGTILAIMASNTSGPTAGLGFEHDTTENTAIYGIEGISMKLISAAGTNLFDARLLVYYVNHKLTFGVDKTSGLADGFTFVTSKSCYGYALNTQNIAVYNLISARLSKYASAQPLEYYNCIAFAMPQIITDVVAFNAVSLAQYFTGCKFYNFLINDANYTSMQLWGPESILTNCYFGKIMKLTIQANNTKIVNTIFDHITAYVMNIVAGSVYISNSSFKDANAPYFPFDVLRGGTLYLDNCSFEKTPIENYFNKSVLNYAKIRKVNGVVNSNYSIDGQYYSKWQTALKPVGAPGAWQVVEYSNASLKPKDLKIIEHGVESAVTITFRLWVLNDWSLDAELYVLHDDTETTAPIVKGTSWVENNIQITPINNQIVVIGIRINTRGSAEGNRKIQYASYSYST